MEPLAFRLKNASNPRLRGVMEAASERFGWGKTNPTRRRALASRRVWRRADTFRAAWKSGIDPASKQIKVVRAVQAFECGAVLNPLQLKNQIEGAMMMGIGGALIEAIQFENGRILNAALSKYRVPRFSDTPLLEAVLVDRKDCRRRAPARRRLSGLPRRSEMPCTAPLVSGCGRFP